MKKEDWIWMPHAGHFICGRECQFHLTTYVGNYIVSTVGDFWPDREVRRIKAEVRGIQIEGRGDGWDFDYMKKIGFEDIGYKRKYETMVFIAKSADEKYQCCPWVMESGRDRDCEGYNDAKEAREGHLRLCEKWAGKEITREVDEEYSP